MSVRTVSTVRTLRTYVLGSLAPPLKNITNSNIQLLLLLLLNKNAVASSSSRICTYAAYVQYVHIFFVSTEARL